MLTAPPPTVGNALLRNGPLPAAEVPMASKLARMFGDDAHGEAHFWRQTLDAIHDVLVVVSPEREILYMNEPACRLCGVELDEVRGRPCLEVIECPNCACTCRLFREGEVRDLTVAVYDAEGNKHSMLKNADVLRDSEGRVVGGIEVMKDITTEVDERRQKEARVEAVFREKKRMETLLRNLPVGVFTLRASDMEVLSCSERMADITGYSRNVLIGSSFHTLFQLDEDTSFPKDLDALTAGALPLLLRTRGGAARRVELRFKRCRHSAGELLGVLRDLDGKGDLDQPRQEFTDFHGMVTASNRMMGVFRLLEKAAETDASVLLQGETGTGKELLARALHRLSQRRNAPFKALNCATLRGELLLSSLFGHEKGAFTGASARKQGKLEAAGAGTLFLDEIHEMPYEHQSVLLRVLEEGSFERVGGNVSIELRARVVCATNTDLQQAVDEGRFRRDLYYRVNVFPIEVPPLRERSEDIALLVRYFARRKARELNEPPRAVDAEVLQALQRHLWPGNIRELKNVVEYLHFVSEDTIHLAHLPEALRSLAAPTPPAPVDSSDDERTRILRALEDARFNKTEAAAALGINRTTLWRKTRRLGISC
jgi:PAS domain S-box-containing protein